MVSWTSSVLAAEVCEQKAIGGLVGRYEEKGRVNTTAMRHYMYLNKKMKYGYDKLLQETNPYIVEKILTQLRDLPTVTQNRILKALNRVAIRDSSALTELKIRLGTIIDEGSLPLAQLNRLEVMAKRIRWLSSNQNLFTYKEYLLEQPVPKNWQREHQRKIKLLDGLKSSESISKHKKQINDEQALQLFKRISESKQMSLECTVGYCAVRASAYTLEAKELKISKNSVVKLWVDKGDVKGPPIFKHKDGNWHFHVVSAVKTENGWAALDPALFDRPVPVQEWYDKMSEISSGEEFNLFVTEAVRTSEAINKPVYKSKIKSKDEAVNNMLKLYQNYLDDFKSRVKRKKK